MILAAIALAATIDAEQARTSREPERLWMVASMAPLGMPVPILASHIGSPPIQNVITGGTVTLGGNIVTAGAFMLSGAYSLTATLTNTTAVTFPTSGTLATLAGSENLTNKTVTGATITGGTAAALTSFGIRSTGAAFDLKFATSEALSADRTVSWIVGNAARTITLSGNPTLADWFDQGVKTTSTPTFGATTLTGNLTMPNAGRITNAGAGYMLFNDGDQKIQFLGTVAVTANSLFSAPEFDVSDSGHAGIVETSAVDLRYTGLTAGEIVALTESANTAVLEGHTGGDAFDVFYTVEAADATASHQQIRAGHVVVTTSDTTCSVTGQMGVQRPTELDDGSSGKTVLTGTLAYTWGTSVASTTCYVTLNAVSSLTQTTLAFRPITIQPHAQNGFMNTSSAGTKTPSTPTEGGIRWFARTSTTTLNTGATQTNSANHQDGNPLIPAHSDVLSVTCIVSTAVTTATTIDVNDVQLNFDDTGSTSNWGALSGVTLGSTSSAGIWAPSRAGTAMGDYPPEYDTATHLVFTTNVNPGAGAVKCTVVGYQRITPTN